MCESSLVSICIPVFNGEKYLEETLESVSGQTYGNIEILIQDNASNDNTNKIVNKFKERDKRVEVVTNVKNYSMARNWNLVINRAKGKYVLLLSADDLLDSTFIEKCIDAFDANGEIDFVTSEHKLLYVDYVRARRVTAKHGMQPVISSVVLLKNPYSINFTLFKASFLNRIKLGNNRVFRDPYFTCDYDLWLRSAKIGSHAYFISESLGLYRVHDDSLSNKKIKMIKQTALVLAANTEYLKKFSPFILRLTYLRLLARVYVRAYNSKYKYSRLKKFLLLKALA